eukprot:3462629-Ditylum_brightwellii.AAC.1
MAKGWKNHVSVVQCEIKHVLISSSKLHQTSNNNNDNTGDKTTVATPTDNHDFSTSLQHTEKQQSMTVQDKMKPCLNEILGSGFTTMMIV